MTKRYHHGDLKNALIGAGTAILSREGSGALSLRRVALEAGVSHAAPYAHFADKRALVAAITTEGFRKLHGLLVEAIGTAEGDPEGALRAAARRYVRFAREERDSFKAMFSGILEGERDFPEFVDMSKRTLALVVDLVGRCQTPDVVGGQAPEPAVGCQAPEPAVGCQAPSTVWGQTSGQPARCQAPAAVERTAVALWSAVHGFASLLVDGQLPSSLLDRESVDGLVDDLVSRFIQPPAGDRPPATERRPPRSSVSD